MIHFFFLLLQVFSSNTGPDPWTAPLVQAEDPAFTEHLQETPGIWEGRPDEKWLREIQSTEIETITFNRGGSSISLRLRFKDGTSAAFKPDQHHEHTVPRFEIAAYRLNRQLGLSRVPPATWRILTRGEIFGKFNEKGSVFRNRVRNEIKWNEDGSVAGEVSVWIPVIRVVPLESLEYRRNWVRWLAPYDFLRREEYSMAGQISKMILFDFLVNNPDRFSGANTLADRAISRLYFMDNTFAFFPNPEGSPTCRQYMRHVRRYSRSMLESIRALDRVTVEKRIALQKDAPWPILTEREIDAFMQRRDNLLREVTRNIAQFGWDRTVIFP